MMSTSEHMRVVVRVRPADEKKSECVWRVEGNTVRLCTNNNNNNNNAIEAGNGSGGRDSGGGDDILTGRERDSTSVGSGSGSNAKFLVDTVIDGRSSTQQLYENCVKDVIESSLEGINSTVFAYGQTSSGKTFTMRGSDDGLEAGVTPLAIHDIFARVEELEGVREFLIRVSYMELYNEEIYDLLNQDEGGSNGKLQVHESAERGIYVAGLHEEVVTSPSQVIELLNHGDRARRTGSTNMNIRSSRSHSLFRMVIESRDIGDLDAVKVSTLMLVDLAGSERLNKTGATGGRAKEGASINKSLLTLSNVITKLSEAISNGASGGTHVHVPYRDSKLTRILQPSLGGNARTVIICAINPMWEHSDETIGTLRFATRAKKVQNTAVVNEVVNERALLCRQKKEIEMLREKLQTQVTAGSRSAVEDEVRALRNALLEKEELNELIKSELNEEKIEKEKQRRQIEGLTRIVMLDRRSISLSSDEEVVNGNSVALDKESYNTRPQKRGSRRETWCPGVDEIGKSSIQDNAAFIGKHREGGKTNSIENAHSKVQYSNELELSAKRRNTISKIQTQNLQNVSESAAIEQGSHSKSLSSLATNTHVSKHDHTPIVMNVSINEESKIIITPQIVEHIDLTLEVKKEIKVEEHVIEVVDVMSPESVPIQVCVNVIDSDKEELLSYEIQTLQNDAKAYEERLSKLNENLHEAIKFSGKCTYDMNMLKESHKVEIEQLKEKLAADGKEHVLTIENLEVNSQHEISNLKLKLDAALLKAADCEKLQKENGAIENKLSCIDTENQNLKLQLLEVTKENSLLESEISDLTRGAEQSENDKAYLKANLLDLKEQISEYESLKESKIDYENKCRQLESDLKSRNIQLHKMIEVYNKLKKKHIKKGENADALENFRETTSFEFELDYVNNKRKQLTKKLESVENDKSRLEKENRILKERLGNVS